MNFIDRLAFIFFAWGIFWAFNANQRGMQTAVKLMICGTALMALSILYAAARGVEAERQGKGDRK